jgi:hypothetical protein
MGLKGSMTRIVVMKYAYCISIRKHEGKKTLGDLAVGERILSK